MPPEDMASSQRKIKIGDLSMNMIAQAYLHNLMGQCIDEFPCTGLNVKGLNHYADNIKESEVEGLHQEFGIIKNGIAQIMELNRHQ